MSRSTRSASSTSASGVTASTVRSLLRSTTWAPLIVALGCGHVGINLDGERTNVDAAAQGSVNPTSDDPTDTTKPSTRVPPTTDKTAVDVSDVTWDGGADDPSDTTSPRRMRDAGRSRRDGGPRGVGPGRNRDASVNPGPVRTDAGATRDAAITPLTEAGVTQDASKGAPADASLQTEAGHGNDGGVWVPTDSAVLDSGKPSACSPTCVCANELVCDLECGPDECSPVCLSGSECDIAIGDAPKLEVACALGAVCSAVAPTGKEVEVVCQGEGECRASCGDTEDCLLKCVGTGKCVLFCERAEECTIECADDAECYAVQNDPDVDIATDCESRVECGDGIVACNADCP